MLLLTSFFQWWYGDGLRRRIKIIANRIDGVTDYFSFSLLLKTLFSPFRQISAGSVDGPLDAKLRALVDRLVSRVIGAIIRLIIMFVGLVSLILLVLYSVVFLICWALVPLFPVAGLVLMTTGWAP